MPRKTLQPDLLNKPQSRSSIVMASGFIIDLAKPVVRGLPISDIARALASQPRWGGATRPWYSVAEHSVFCSTLVPPAYQFDALMHDCEEFLGDFPTPLKNQLGRETLQRVMQPLKYALAKEFGFRLDLAVVKHADLQCLATELRDLLPPHWMEWHQLPTPAAEKIIPIGPDAAERLFLSRFAQLKPTMAAEPNH